MHYRRMMCMRMIWVIALLLLKEYCVCRRQHSVDPDAERRIRIIPGKHKNKGYGRLVRELLQKTELSVAQSRGLN